MSTPIVRVHQLTKVFGEGETRVQAVRSVELELERGEIVLVMGPSGSGKTTLLSMLGGLLRPSSGEIVVDGVDIAALPERELPPFRATRFGFIFQDFNLLAALSARENVEVALNLAGVRRAATRARDLLVALGLGERVDFSVEQLSGGEKQRVAIARAVANRPQLIFADEPTANLDSGHGAETMRLLRRLAKEERTMVVIVSHDARLREVADRVLWLEDGRLKALAALVRDPVCGMLLDPERSPARLDEDGSVLYFCSRGCREQYEQEGGRLTETALVENIPRAGLVVKTKEEQMHTNTYSVPGMHCAHCQAAVVREVKAVSGVESVDVDLETKLVTIHGDGLDDAALIAAIDEAGYEAERVAA